MILHTGHISYGGSDRMDITVRSASNTARMFTPTWGMVMGYKDGSISEAEYTHMYTNLMRQSYRLKKKAWHEVLSREELTICCFCNPGAFCHRVLLAGFLQKLGADYQGEHDAAAMPTMSELERTKRLLQERAEGY